MPRPKHQPTTDAPLPLRLPPGISKADALYQVLVQLAGQIGAGGLIPSERVLAEHFGMARTTVRQSVQQLLTDGVLFRRHGHGTFVAAQRPGYIDMLTSFSRDMRARGLTPGARVLTAEVEPASRVVAARLQVAAGSPVLRLERLRTADGRPMALERITVPAERFPGIADLDWADRSFYEELERGWGVQVGGSDSQVAAVLPDPADAELLDIDPIQPCLLVDAIVHDTRGVVFEAGRAWYRGDQYEAVVRARRPAS
ncbi:GntR family transcriptional regulator [Actinoplanes sp. NPDC089786]|uniref:GntR family transcriptional regulator n=1 Tax=Actinoplanes sp. NPDC089786 TaxID=3155185 RepID=UPI0034209E8C